MPSQVWVSFFSRVAVSSGDLDKECSPRFSQQFQIFILFILKILFILSILLALLSKAQSARGAMPARLNIRALPRDARLSLEGPGGIQPKSLLSAKRHEFGLGTKVHDAVGNRWCGKATFA